LSGVGALWDWDCVGLGVNPDEEDFAEVVFLGSFRALM